MRSKHGFYSLKKPKFRQSWNKYNLYNLTRIPQLLSTRGTLFQNKWAAKSMTRAYHGGQLKERQWIKMFRPRPHAVLPMDYRELAASDGSSHALGRGSGLNLEPGKRQKRLPVTSYMSMVYWPTERRLDTAIFRAMFASSTKQARQFVLHGFVKVNGRKMPHPGYLLNPGDLFQIDPERVLFATGAPKTPIERQQTRRHRKKTKAEAVKAAEEKAKLESSENISEGSTDTVNETNVDITTKEENEENEENEEENEDKEEKEEEEAVDQKIVLNTLLSQAKSILSNSRDDLSAKRKQDLRAFQKAVQKTISRAHKDKTVLTASLEAEFLEITNKIAASVDAKSSDSDGNHKTTLPATERKNLQLAFREVMENPVDPSKPYATPWHPRDYMSAFAFIPRYLEVNHSICAAVYLRHPVVRPGLAEVPTPFNPEVSLLAFNWYLKRR